MARKAIDQGLTRRDLLVGAGSALVASRAFGAATQTGKSGNGFDVDTFIADCIAANRAGDDAQAAVKEVIARAMSDPAAVVASVGEPQKGGLKALYRSP